MQIWQLQEAKAKFSEVVKMSQIEPQIITVRGEEESVILSKEQYDKLSSKETSLVSLMQKSPLCGVNLDLKRDISLSRDIEL